MRQLLTVFVLSVAIQPSALAASGSIGVADLRQIVAKVKNFHPKDQFDTPPSLPVLSGRSFDITLPLKESGLNNSICTGDAFWGYSTEKQILGIFYGRGESVVNLSDTDALMHPRARFTFNCIKTNSKKAMQNAFGATRLVDVEYQNYDAIEAQNIDGGVTGREFDIPMVGGVAREVSKTLQLRVSGTFSTDKSGQATNCDVDVSQATLDFPTEENKKYCSLAAHVSLVQLIDGKSGRVLGNLFEDRGTESPTESSKQPLSNDAKAQPPYGLPLPQEQVIQLADEGNAVAQYRLGVLYEHGQGVTADPVTAASWYEKAALQGNRQAMHNLAVYYVGRSEMGEAVRWFAKAASLGLRDSQFNLAVLYERGAGVSQSLPDAYRWYLIGAAAGDNSAQQRAAVLATRLSKADLATARKLALQFKALPLNIAANVPPEQMNLVGH